MLGEVGNHTFGVALGIAFYLIGGFWWLLLFSIITTTIIAFVRRNTLRVFFSQRLGLVNPVFGDYFMDVLTGGGLGDLLRKYILKDNQYSVENPWLIYTMEDNAFSLSICSSEEQSFVFFFFLEQRFLLDSIWDCVQPVV